MPLQRSGPFLSALTELRRRIARGAYRPQMHLAAADLAAELGLSPTPMREALARLTPMARQAQQLYAALLAVEPSRDEAAANYTAQGRPGALAGGGREIVDVIHG